MHELSIAKNILEMVEREARVHNAGSIKMIKIKLGEFTGIVKEALVFAFEIARQGTVAESAELSVEIVALEKRCLRCSQNPTEHDKYNFICTVCNTPLQISAGRELLLEYIETD